MELQSIDLRVPGGDKPRSANEKINSNFQEVAEELERLDQTRTRITSGIGTSETMAVSQKAFTLAIYGSQEAIPCDCGGAPSAPEVRPDNHIGTQGKKGFGVGTTDTLPDGMETLPGTLIPERDEYGNYKVTSDGSIMVWIPAFYHRWGSAESPRYGKYKGHALDIVPIDTFTDLDEAAASGYTLHRAFYDGGAIQKGFFIDKYLCSMDEARTRLRSIQGQPPVRIYSNGPSLRELNSSYKIAADTLDAAKTRGPDYFPTTFFINRVAAMLSLAQAQAAQSQDDCAWFGQTLNFPRGNNGQYADLQDQTVEFTGDVQPGSVRTTLTGSGVPFNMTTHNGQNNGISDLKGNLYETTWGINIIGSSFYSYSVHLHAKDARGHNTDLQGSEWFGGGKENCDDIGNPVGLFTTPSFDPQQGYFGHPENSGFSSDTTGPNWVVTSACIPSVQTATVDAIPEFQGSLMHTQRLLDRDPLNHPIAIYAGGRSRSSNSEGIWSVFVDYSSSTEYGGVRLARYV